MAIMFRAVLGSSGGTGIPLIVTCASEFAGLTITCSDGTTALTDTCPSLSPYEITFNLPNTGTWTISGTINEETFYTNVEVSDFELDLTTLCDIEVDVYSAANDTVSYVGLDNQTHTITTDSAGYASATITTNARGSNITFTSTIAKDPSDLSNAYSKTITLSSATTIIYVCPDGTLYWYGYRKVPFSPQNYRYAGAASSSWIAKAPTITYGINNFTYAQPKQSSNSAGIWISDSIINLSDYTDINCIASNFVAGNATGSTKGPTVVGSATHADGYTEIAPKILNNTTSTPELFSESLDKSTYTNQYMGIYSMSSGSGQTAEVKIYALWLE